MEQALSQGLRRWLPAVATLAVAALAAVVILFVALYALASAKHRGVERRWAETLGTPEALRERFPRTEASAAALELERLSARLGIDTAPRAAEGRQRPTPEAVAEHSGIKRERDWVVRQVERAERGLEPPPAKLRAWFEAHAGDLAAIRRHLVEGGVLQWERDIEEWVSAPIPNLLGHIDLQKALLGEAFIKILEGDRETALGDVDAIWHLGQSLRREPMVIVQLIALSDLHAVAAALRQIRDVPEIWRERLAQHDSSAAFRTALKVEGSAWTHIEDPWSSAQGFADRETPVRLLRAVARPYARYCIADTSDAYRRRVVNLDRVAAICDYDLAAEEADLDVPIPRWNLIGGLLVGNLAPTTSRLARLELDLELTAKLLEIEHDRALNGGAWPAPSPGIESSAACPRDRWLYEVAPDGSMTLAFARELAWPDVAVRVGPRYPTRFSVAP